MADTMLRRASEFIVDRRVVFFALFAVLVVYSALSVGRVSVNSDLTASLPADTPTRRGLTIMEDEFTTYATANVMVSNIAPGKARDLADEIEDMARAVRRRRARHRRRHERARSAGVDGISREGQAQAVAYDEMVAREGSPDIFKRLTVSYVVDGELLKAVVVDYGGQIDGEPVVGQRDGMYWQWDDYDREDIRINQIVEASWRNLITTIASEGVQAYSLSVSGFDGGMLTVRYCIDDEGALRVSRGGTLSEAPYRRDGRYIVFELENGGDFTFVPGRGVPAWALPTTAVAVAAAAGVAFPIVRRRRKRRPAERT